jgi:hypothetical protein
MRGEPARLLLLGALIPLLFGCDDTLVTTGASGLDPQQVADHQILHGEASAISGLTPTPARASQHGARNFVAQLSGGEEVPPVDTRARGQAIFQLSSDGTELSYRLIVAHIENVTQAHIHVAPAGTNGPVTAWLYPSGPPALLIPDRSDGVLATGVITTENLVGPLAASTLDDLLDLMRTGQTYVNVHTSQFPPGEIRGQIR